MLDWLKEGWFLGWGAFIVSLVTAIGTVLRNRMALRRASLDYEKLELEVQRLRKSPELVADRREIYDRLRMVLQRITGSADATYEEVWLLHEIFHDASFRFPDEVAQGIRSLISDVVILYVTNKQLDSGRYHLPSADRDKLVERNALALDRVGQYEQDLVKTYKLHVSL